MLWRFKTQATALFLDVKSNYSLDADKQYAIILSPALYWVKRVSLPVKHIRDAKKLAPSVFEETLPQGNYSYDAQKEAEGVFLLFAYEDKKILDLLLEKNIANNSVRSISFAQEILDDDEKYQLDNERVIVKKEGIVTILPAAWFEGLQALDMASLNMPKKSIKLEQFGHIVETKTLYMGALLLACFTLLLGVEYFVYSEQKATLEEEKTALFSKYKLKPTMMQNRAILAHYTKIDKEQEHLRMYLKYLEKIVLKLDEHIEHIRYKNHILTLTLQGVTNQESRRVLAVLVKNSIPFTKKFEKEKLFVEIKL
ncbi:hypothetical protein [Sulfurimonas indica]|uniref:hypothetical protein n=1 Tax=Sulfurimonas indica TaxID=2508707 RepID=UPI0012647737|nr:hypothetical protein [Sulfurimonas indica]